MDPAKLVPASRSEVPELIIVRRQLDSTSIPGQASMKKMSRRDALKIGGLAAVGGAALAIPLGHSVSGSTPSLLPSKSMPVPYRTTFGRLGVLDKVGHEDFPADGMGPIDYYDIAAKPGSANLVPGFPATRLLGYEGLIPARRIEVNVGTRIVMKMHNKLLPTDGTFGSPMNFVDSFARLGIAAPVRRLRQRSHAARAGEDLPLSEHPVGADPVVPRPRRALDRTERLLRVGFAISPA